MAGSEPERTLGRRATISKGVDYSITLTKATTTAEAIGKVRGACYALGHGLKNIRLFRS